jgi:GT2 family glycosyltransferase
VDSCLLSIIIVNYNAGAFLPRCLCSIEAQTLRDHEVIIVDNGSSDGSLEVVQESERVQIIHNQQNLGFAAAQNQGIRHARGRYLMPLNFDIEMTPRFLEEMVAAIEKSPGIGLVTGKLVQMSADGEHLDTFYSTGHILPPDRFVHHRGAGEYDRGQYNDMEEVFGAPGAAPLYRREMLESIAFRGAYFDESLFTWYEDVDIDWRAKRMGWKCIYNPKAVAYHVGHPEGHGSDLWKISTQIRNRWLVILANDDFAPFSKKTWAMFLYELGLIRYVLLQGYSSAYLIAIRGFLDLIPITLAKRRWTMERARSTGFDLESIENRLA